MLKKFQIVAQNSWVFANYQHAIRLYANINSNFGLFTTHSFTNSKKGKDQSGNSMVMSKVIRLMNKQDLVTNCLAYFAEMGVPAPDSSTIFHYLAECFPGMFQH